MKWSVVVLPQKRPAANYLSPCSPLFQSCPYCVLTFDRPLSIYGLVLLYIGTP